MTSLMVWDLPSFHSRGSRTTSREREIGEAKAQEQESLILAWFKANPGAWSPSQVHERVFSGRVPLTSTRARITTLTNKGQLRKTDARVDGPMGRPEHTWTVCEVKE